MKRYTAMAYAVIDEKYAVSMVAGIATSRLFLKPLNRFTKANSASQLSFRWLLGISVKEWVISTPLLVAFTIINRNGRKQIAASRLRHR